MKSIKLYLVVAILSTITLLSFLAALHGYQASVAAADKLFDDQLKETSKLLEMIAPQAAADERHIGKFQHSDRLVVQIWRREQLLLSNGPREPIGEFKAGFAYNNFDGYRWRSYARYDPRYDRWLIIAERSDKRFLLAELIARESIVPVVISLPIAAFIIWIIIRSGFALLEQLANDLAKKKADDLSPIIYDAMPRELAPVIYSVNALFARLADAFDREKRFAADAAHELRTPIAALRINLHNLKFELDDHAEKIEAVNQDVLRLEYLVEQILSLYRTTPAHFQARLNRVDLYQVVQEVIVDMYNEFENKAQTIELSGESSLLVGDASALSILTLNLLTNANKYTPAGGSIGVRVEQNDRDIILVVADTGPGIPLADHERVFDRFYRVGGDQHGSNQSGCGLGLSIVKHIVFLHHANIRLASPDLGTGLIVTVSFPKVSEDGAA